MTAFTRAPARGRWDDGEQVQTDDVVVFEVMDDALDRDWWAALRGRIERELDQQEVLVRAHPVERL